MCDKVLKFDDTVVSTIAKTLQLALLTGTDVVDNSDRLKSKKMKMERCQSPLITIASSNIGWQSC